MNKSDKTVTIERVFDAPVALVWEAWTQPEHIAQWWSPKGMVTTVIMHEFEVGGKWKYAMPMPDGKEFIAEGEYTEIVAQQRIVSKANFRPMTEGVVIEAIFEAVGKQTAFTFNVIHPTVEYKLQQEKMGIINGWGSVFTRLEEHLKTI